MPPVLACRQDSIYDLVRSRWGWLLLFFGGLVLAAIVVEAFEEVLKQHVQLSYFGERLGQGGGSWCGAQQELVRCAAGAAVASAAGAAVGGAAGAGARAQPDQRGCSLASARPA